ncbi:hypothetical protein ACP3V3_02530 [Vibrio sp. PNB22_3_1]
MKLIFLKALVVPVLYFVGFMIGMVKALAMLTTEALSSGVENEPRG